MPNLASEPIVAVDQWPGIVTAYDFNPASPSPSSFNLYLEADPATLAAMTEAQVATALQTWTTISGQVSEPGVTFVVQTNLAVDASGNAVDVLLTASQSNQLVALAAGMVTALSAFPLQSGALPPAATLTFSASGTGTLPPAFELSVRFQIQLDPAFAQTATSAIASTVARTLPGVTEPVQIGDFAAAFVQAFPQLVLATDPAASGSLWAVQRALLDVQVGGANGGPFFSAPAPLDTALNSSTVTMPQLPESLVPPGTTLPAQQFFSDVDLDRLANGFFEAVDNFLSPGSAAFKAAPDAYADTVTARQTLANLYSTNAIDWLFADDANGQPSPYTGTANQLKLAQIAFEQQMCATLAAAYTSHTIVQYGVSWDTLHSNIGASYTLYGTIVPSSPNTVECTVSAAAVPITNGEPSTLTLLVGVAGVQDLTNVTLGLAWNVTHLEIAAGQAEASMRLELVNPYATLPQIGTGIDIPLVFRQYPTPPVLVSQQAIQGSSQPSSGNALADAAAWQFVFAYQVQLTPHDRIHTSITYNTNLSAAAGMQSPANRDAAMSGTVYTLFEALTRFTATYAVILPVLASPDGTQTWIDAANVFRDLVNDVVNNATWNASAEAVTLTAGSLLHISDTYQVTDVAQENGQRLVTLSWDANEPSFSGAQLAVVALDPTAREPYADHTAGRATNAVTDLYTPAPPLRNDAVMHQVTADLHVLVAENALAAVQIERNVAGLPGNAPAWFAKSAYVYTTPTVHATEPIAPLLDDSTPIDLATLPNQSISTGCPSAPPAGVSSLCSRIYTMMFDLLSGSAVAGGTERQLAIACTYDYPIDPVSTSIPVLLVPSLLIEPSESQQLSEFSDMAATSIAIWAADHDVVFGESAQSGARLVFDLTLYALLSEPNVPLLRLRNVELALTDVEP